MAIRVRFERTTARLEGECSIQLSYRTADVIFVSKADEGVNLGMRGFAANFGLGPSNLGLLDGRGLAAELTEEARDALVKIAAGDLRIAHTFELFQNQRKSRFIEG